MIKITRKDEELEESMKYLRIMKGREKIITHNSNCIMETISFYDNVLINDIIKPSLFNANYEDIPEIKEIINDRLSFMDKYKITCKIAKHNKVETFKKFDSFIKMRNEIAHNITSVLNIQRDNKESDISYGGKQITWSQYKKKIKEWSQLSYDMSKFILNVFNCVNKDKKNAGFIYCKIEGGCVLVENMLLWPKIKENYTCFFRNGFNMDLLDFVKEELNNDSIN